MPKVAKVNSSDELGLSAGKNSLLSTLANRPNTVKSNHSNALPMVEEITTRRRICAMASACIRSHLFPIGGGFALADRDVSWGNKPQRTAFVQFGLQRS